MKTHNLVRAVGNHSDEELLKLFKLDSLMTGFSDEKILSIIKRVKQIKEDARIDLDTTSNNRNAVRPSNNRNVVRSNNNRNAVRPSNNRNVVRSNNNRNAVRPSNNRNVVRSNNNRNVVRSNNNRNVVRSNNNRNVVRSNNNRNAVRPSNSNRNAVRSNNNRNAVRSSNNRNAVRSSNNRNARRPKKINSSSTLYKVDTTNFTKRPLYFPTAKNCRFLCWKTINKRLQGLIVQDCVSYKIDERNVVYHISATEERLPERKHEVCDTVFAKFKRTKLVTSESSRSAKIIRGEVIEYSFIESESRSMATCYIIPYRVSYNMQ